MKKIKIPTTTNDSTKKIIIPATSEINLFDFFQGYVGDLKHRIDDYVNTYGAKAWFEIRHSYDNIELYINYHREETFDEQRQRIATNKKKREKAKKVKVSKEIKDRKLWEKLNKKFGNE